MRKKVSGTVSRLVARQVGMIFPCGTSTLVNQQDSKHCQIVENSGAVYSAGLEREAKLRPHACQAVPEAVTDTDPWIVEDPQLGWLGGTNVDPELELIGDLEWTLTWEGEFGRWEEVIVNKGNPDIGHETLHIQTERMPNFQAVLECPIVRVRAPGRSYRSISCRGQPGADAQDEILQLELEEVADPSRVEEDKTFFYMKFPS